MERDQAKSNQKSDNAFRESQLPILDIVRILVFLILQFENGVK